MNRRILPDFNASIQRRFGRWINSAHSVSVDRLVGQARLIGRWVLANGHMSVSQERSNRWWRWAIVVGDEQVDEQADEQVDALLFVDDARFGNGMQIQIVYFLRAEFWRRNRWDLKHSKCFFGNAY